MYIYTYIHTCCTYNMHVYKPYILYVFAIAVNTSRVSPNLSVYFGCNNVITAGVVFILKVGKL